MQKRPKKILSFLLALALIISMPTGTQAAEAAAPLEAGNIINSGAAPEDLASPSDASPLGVSLFEADTTPPAFVAGYPQDVPQSAGSRSISIHIRAQEPCFYSIVLLLDGADAPSKEQVRDRQDGEGQPASWWTDCRDTPIANIQTSMLVPQHSTDYDAYIVLMDEAGNLSEPEKLDITSPAPAEYFASGYPMTGAVQANGSNQVEIKLKLQNIEEGGNGRVYMVLLPDGADAPNLQQVFEGKGGDGNTAVYAGGQSFTSGVEHTVLVTGAAGGTDYDLYFVADDAGATALLSCTDVVKLDVTTPPDLSGNVCRIDTTEYATLQAAVNAANYTPTTITLLKGFTTVQGLVISGKQITLALGGYTVNIDNPGAMGLQMQGGTLALSGTGALNVKGSVYGMWANGGTATVTNATSGVDSAAIGVYAQSGAQVMVLENASGSAHGVKAQGAVTKVTVNGDVSNTQMENAVDSHSAEIFVKGDVNSQGNGVYANTGRIIVEGDVNAITVGVWTENIGTEVYVKGNLHANSFGIILSGSGSITVDGEITLTSPIAYIRLSFDLEKGDGIPDVGKPGYLKYSALGSSGVVWVKAPVAYVCEVDGIPHATLDAALASFSGPTLKTVKLLQTIDYSGGLVLTDKRVRFDLNGYNLNISNPGGIGLEVRSGAWVQHTDNGELNVSGKIGVRAENVGTIVSVTNASSTGGADSAGVYASYAQITVTNNVTGGETGVLAQHTGGQVLVKGDVTGSYVALRAQNNALLTAKGNVSASYTGALVEGIDGTTPTIVVEKNLTSADIGAEVRSAGGSVTVEGEISAAVTFVRIGSVNLTKEQGTADSGKPGFAKYSAAGPISGTVWVKGYAVTVNNGIANPSIAPQGTIITLISPPAPNGQRFKDWSITPSVTFVEGNLTSAIAKFTMPALAVTATAAYEAIPATVDSVAVSPSTVTMQKGSTYQFSATVTGTNNPSQSVTWSVAGGIAGTSVSSSGLLTVAAGETAASLTVTATSAVDAGKSGTATITLEQPAPTYYTVTVNGSYAGNSGADAYTQGSVVTIYAGSRNGYNFTGWSSSDGVSFANADSASTTFVMPAKNVTITAGWRASGGGGSNGGGSGGSYSGSSAPTATPVPEKKPDQPITASISLTATVGANGIASLNIPDKALADAIAKAQSDARAQGRTGTGIGVELNVGMPQGVSSLLAILYESSLQRLVSSGVSNLSINGAPVSLSLDQSALQEIKRQSSGGITIGIAPQTVLSPQTQRLIGKRPAYNITIGCTDQSGKSQSITSLGRGTATITIPYRPASNETPGYLFGVYVDGSGNPIRIPGSVYDANSRSLLIPTNHFSVYGVGYETPSAKFTDVASHWAKDSIDYVVGRGLLSGTTKTNFSPDTAMTRGMLVTALGRLAGVDIKAFTKNSFTDVKADSAFRPYIEWAYSKGIVQGIGNQQFAPDRAITREEIAVILQNYAKATDYKLPVTRTAITFADASSVGSVYKDAVTAMQQAGIMIGEQSNKFNPKSNATRAEVSAMLHRYIKLTIDPVTAHGWALNDDGQYLYYKDGKALTGTQTIDGIKYFFNTDGTLKTGWVKDSDNWRYYSGNKAAVGWLDISDKRYYFTKEGLMVSGKWLENEGKWYYFNTDGSLAKNTKVDGYEVDENGVRKTK